MELERKQWPIDERLQSLIDRPVRALISEFRLKHYDGNGLLPPTLAQNLILPDNSTVDGLPVFFEGFLKSFERRVGVVFLELEQLRRFEALCGIFYVRSSYAVVVHADAVVKLAHPFQVEPLHIDESHYWRDRREKTAQFKFPFQE